MKTKNELPKSVENVLWSYDVNKIDFDFFYPGSFSTVDLFQKIEQIFAGHIVVKTQETKDTLTVVIDEGVKVSFFAYPYKLVRPLLREANFEIASDDYKCDDNIDCDFTDF